MSVKITPKPKFKLQGVDFATLKPRDCFLYMDELCMKAIKDQGAISLSDGAYLYDMCGEYVQPVDVEIKWKRQ